MKKITSQPIAELINFPFDSNWVNGTVGEYTFEAKLFDDPSSFGIGNGRVSKLSIYHTTDCIVNYDRGWDIKPSKGAQPYYKSVLALLESTPRRFDFEKAVN